jgi:hypothetical protein
VMDVGDAEKVQEDIGDGRGAVDLRILHEEIVPLTRRPRKSGMPVE